MEKSEIERECKEILKEYSLDRSKVDELKPTDEIAETLGLDSLDLVEMVMTLEEHFEVSIEEEDIAKIKTFSDMVTYIEGKLSSKN